MPYERMMITVIWGVHGIDILDRLPEGESFNSTYFVEKSLKPLQAQGDVIWPRGINQKIWLNLDNCRAHNSQYTQTEMKE